MRLRSFLLLTAFFQALVGCGPDVSMRSAPIGLEEVSASFGEPDVCGVAELSFPTSSGSQDEQYTLFFIEYVDSQTCFLLNSRAQVLGQLIADGICIVLESSLKDGFKPNVLSEGDGRKITEISMANESPVELVGLNVAFIVWFDDGSSAFIGEGGSVLLQLDKNKEEIRR